jgi:hypothetical protein
MSSVVRQLECINCRATVISAPSDLGFVAKEWRKLPSDLFPDGPNLHKSRSKAFLEDTVRTAGSVSFEPKRGKEEI